MIFAVLKKLGMLVLFGGLLMPFSVEAFIPQGPHLIELMTQKIKQPSGMVVLQTRKIINHDNQDQGVTQVEEKLVYSFPGRFRSDITMGPHESICVESNGRFLRIQDGVTVSYEKGLSDRYVDIPLYRDREELIQYLETAGMNIDAVSMQRYNDAVVFVLGMSSGEKEVPTSLWIDQDTFFPLKYILNQDGNRVEIFYENWERVSKTWYPMQISIFLNQQLISLIQASEFKLESGFSDILFDIDGLVDLYPPSVVTEPGDDSDKIEALEEDIEAFKKLYE